MTKIMKNVGFIAFWAPQNGAQRMFKIMKTLMLQWIFLCRSPLAGGRGTRVAIEKMGRVAIKEMDGDWSLCGVAIKEMNGYLVRYPLFIWDFLLYSN